MTLLDSLIQDGKKYESIIKCAQQIVNKSDEQLTDSFNSWECTPDNKMYKPNNHNRGVITNKEIANIIKEGKE